MIDTTTTVYNFTVGDAHTYFVGNEHILVHNDCGQKVTKDFNQARNEAMDWLDQKGFKAEEPTPGKFGNQGKNVDMRTKDGKTGFRVEHDERNGAHINVWSGKEKEPHIHLKLRKKL